MERGIEGYLTPEEWDRVTKKFIELGKILEEARTAKKCLRRLQKKHTNPAAKNPKTKKKS